MSEADRYTTYPPYATWAVHLGGDGWIYAECLSAEGYYPEDNEKHASTLRQLSGEYTGREWMDVVRHGIVAKGGEVYYTVDFSELGQPAIVESMIDFMAEAFSSVNLATHLNYHSNAEPPDFFDEDEKDLTVLMRKARDGEIEWIDDLIERYAELEFEDDLGCTALMHAAYSGQLEVVERLLRAGADANHQTLKQRTALMMALESRSENRDEIVRTLLALGADPNLPDGWGRTALDLCFYVDPAMSNLLRQFGGKRARELRPLWKSPWFYWPALLIGVIVAIYGGWWLAMLLRY